VQAPGGSRSQQRHARTDAALRLQLRGVATARALRQYEVGTSTYGRPKDQDFGCGAILSIGDYTSIAGEVEILLGGAHSRDRITTYPFATLWPEGKHLPVPRATKGESVSEAMCGSASGSPSFPA